MQYVERLALKVHAYRNMHAKRQALTTFTHMKRPALK